jgi:S-adenosyl methyltransferase
MRRLLDALPSGSYLALADSIDVGDAHREAARHYSEGGPVAYHLRSREQIAGFFDGLDLVEPGLVAVSRWRPEPSPFGGPQVETTLGGIGRKP